MTPQERSNLIQLGGLVGCDDAERLHAEIADAIRAAVAEEREACAMECRGIAVSYLCGPQIEGFGRMAEVADKCNHAILARGND